MIDRAIELRRKGLTYESIASELKTPKSTIYSWLKTVQLSELENELIDIRLKETYKNASKRLVLAKKQKSLEVDRVIFEESNEILGNYNKTPESEKIILSMLFWAEGEKNTSSGLRFINSDPLMVKLYLKLLRSNFNITESKLKVMLHVHDYHNIKVQLEYWSNVTSIKKEQFYNPYLKKNTGKQKNLDYQGTVSIRYSDYKLGKLLKMIYTNYGQL